MASVSPDPTQDQASQGLKVWQRLEAHTTLYGSFIFSLSFWFPQADAGIGDGQAIPGRCTRNVIHYFYPQVFSSELWLTHLIEWAIMLMDWSSLEVSHVILAECGGSTWQFDRFILSIRGEAATWIDWACSWAWGLCLDGLSESVQYGDNRRGWPP